LNPRSSLRAAGCAGLQIALHDFENHLRLEVNLAWAVDQIMNSEKVERRKKR